MINKLRNITPYFLLIIFLSVKVAGWHVFTHTDDDDVSCELCDFTFINSHIPALNNDFSISFVEPAEFLIFEIKLFYSFIYTGEISSDSLFSRPPPSI
ncbi:hypothetical protein [Abyssalbus ytuae]|uniref:Uncharacterized protein n=1 Tax=Abyssalbus ytuae TaxID=2926907 RepID=A0A9E7D354_9FLAO|nr:hypothetical protein [Abyssalbus ytuae]UOB17469.1 hypothetical protein MQE35_17250 [Abyssalbus ytuae]